MKKILLVLCVVISHLLHAQTCEEKQGKLIQLIAGYSASFLYNTYGMIGSISDGFSNDVYNAKTVIDLLSAQNKVLDHLASETDKLNSENTLSNPQDKTYASTTSSILIGLKKQANLMIEYAKSKTPQRMEAYESQRNKNWEDIAALMGVKK